MSQGSAAIKQQEISQTLARSGATQDKLKAVPSPRLLWMKRLTSNLPLGSCSLGS
jgi:hypothetical protein